MSSKYAKMVKEAMLNNSFDYDVMHDSLKKTWFNSYSYLLYLQQANIEYEELWYYSDDKTSREDSHIGDLYLNKQIYACFDVDYDLIECCDREEYRTSYYYQKELTIKDLVYNQSIFNKIPIVIIDDKVIWDYTLKIQKDSVTFRLPFRRQFVLTDEYDEEKQDWKYVDHKIQILIVNNAFYDRFTFNRNNISLKADRTFSITKSVINSTAIKNISIHTNNEFCEKYGVKDINQLNGTQDRIRRETIMKRNMIADNYEKIGTMMCSIHFQNGNGKEYELGTILIPMKDTGDAFTAEVTEDIYKLLTSSRYSFYMSMVFIPYLRRHDFYTGTNVTTASERGANREICTDIMCVEESYNTPYPSPIPVPNFMVFKKKAASDGYIIEPNKDMIELHYPNIYKVKDEHMNIGDSYQMYYFYYEMPDLKYTVMFDFYFKFLQFKFNDPDTKAYLFSQGGRTGNLFLINGKMRTTSLASLELKDVISASVPFESIINDMYYETATFRDDYTPEMKELFYDTFKKIYEYKFHHYQYGETDFLNRYIKIPEHSKDEPFEYQVNTMREWIEDMPWTLRDYVLEQNKIGTSYHLFTNTLDLSKRIRTDTSKEIDGEVNKFKEKMYVFAFNNDTAYPNSLDMRVFVDGLMVEKYQYRKLYMDYIYIPTRLITKDSYIEVEIFPGYKCKETFSFANMNDKKEFTLLEVPEDIFPTTNDLNYRTSDIEHRELLDPSLFEITVKTERGDIVVSADNPTIKPVEFTRIKTFTIKPKNELLIGKELEFDIRKFGRNIQFTVEKEGYLILKFVGIELSQNFDQNYIRIFDNEGRLLTRDYYRLFTFYDKPYIYFFKKFKVGDVITIDFTPYKYTELCHFESLSEDTTIIDLSDYIDKPFDIRYYDVYLNGRKLSINNVFVLSPYQITLVNIKSIYNLAVYQRERDWEYFGLDYKKHMYYFSYNDLITSKFVTDEDRNQLIKWAIDSQKDPRLNIVPNTNKEKKQAEPDPIGNAVEFSVYYYGNIMPKRYINPETLQESNYILDKQFPLIRDTYKVNKTTMMLEPDIIIEGENKNSMAVFPIGHLNEVDPQVLYPYYTFILDGSVNYDSAILIEDDDTNLPSLVDGTQYLDSVRYIDGVAIFGGSINDGFASLTPGKAPHPGQVFIAHNNLEVEEKFNRDKYTVIKNDNPYPFDINPELFTTTFILNNEGENENIQLFDLEEGSTKKFKILGFTGEIIKE